jgi:hypothetical protein
MAEADDLEAFRKEAADWLEANFPKSLKGRGMMMMGQGGPPVGDDAAKWRKTMGAKGWGTPTWPQRYGGGGLTPAQARVLQQEMAKAGAYNPIGGMGVMMFGPTLLEYGNEEQKTRHIPKICTGEIQWCQGYSEPGSGSDLASLQTRCEDKGDHYLVNGQKIWTSGAHTADWCFCLVRTDTTKKHEGISFILIDMKTPGVNPRPIRLINDTTPFCETFFTDVKVPKENLVGQLNGGWTIAKRRPRRRRRRRRPAARARPGRGQQHRRHRQARHRHGRPRPARRSGFPPPHHAAQDGEPGVRPHRPAFGDGGEKQFRPQRGDLDHEICRREDRAGTHRTHDRSARQSRLRLGRGGLFPV